MVIAILIALFIIATAVWVIYEEGYGILDRIWLSFIGLICVAFLIFVDCFFAFAISNLVPTDEQNIQLSETEKITALKDNISSEGHFFLASATIKDKPYYYYVVQTDRGLKQKKINAEQTYIHYTKEDFRVETYEGVSFKHWYTYIWASNPMAEYYDIYIPKGSVTTEFNIDLE